VNRGRPPRRRGEPQREHEPPRRPQRGRDDLGGDQVEGRRAVRELLLAGRRRVKTVFLSADAEPDPTLDEIAELAGATLRVVPHERVDATARTDAHQGVVALATPLEPADLDTLLDDPDAFLVALDGVTDPRNLGAVMRVAETAGATGVVVPRHRAARVTATVAKAAAGAIEYLPIALVSGVPAALDRASRAGVWSVAVDERAEQSVYDLTLSDQRILVVLGAEGRGLSRLSRERCDVAVRIPMRGLLDSLNVATAAAVVCHEIARGRDIARAARE
jgi:23S rRNA (guanosine2251-2'-O)-methyltransferase